MVDFTCQMKSKTTAAPHKSLLDRFQCTLKCESHVFAPLRQFDGQTVKGKVTDAETKAKRLLIPVERTWEDIEKRDHGHVTCTVSRSGCGHKGERACNG